MAESTAPQRTLPIDLAQTVVSFAVRRGWDVNQLLSGVGVSPMLLAEGRSRLTDEQMIGLVQALWTYTDDEMFGLGEHPLPRGSFRLLCYGLLGAKDLGDALKRTAGFARAMPALPVAHLDVVDGRARLGTTYAPQTRHHPDHLVPLAGLAISHRLLAWAVGRRLRLHLVELPYARPENLEFHQLVFGAPMTFGAEEAALTFDADFLRAPMMRTDAEVEEFVASAPAGLLTRDTQATMLSDQVRRMYELGLKGDPPTGDGIARRLAVSPQTLRRKLAEDGTSLRVIREEVLRDAAVTSLVRGDETVAELAERLGFSEPSAFSRAFRRWTGSSPGAYRREGGES
ncbi:AraC family transcriptional regulator [Nocardioides sp. WS12]|uniref:AraC family transcriptional regulator n=1 Tax=Nocardioides sp. WS12 TaxID=2486272 RepID=UPI0015FE2FF2|nr:AraC family transcriptional regulator [Nocardioides sp. WS12]